MSGAVDFYPTPAWCADEGARLIDYYGPAVARVIDPCAGTGALLDAMARRNGERGGIVTVFGLELDPELAAQSTYPINVEDSLESTWPPCDVALMNPPFSLAQEFVEEAREQCTTVVALLRLSFLASQKREGFWRGPKPDVHVLAKRPIFRKKGDNAEYGWFVWSPLATGRWTRIEARPAVVAVRQLKAAS